MGLLDMSLCGGAMIAAVLFLRLILLHRLPRWTFTVLWWVALLRLLLPVTLPSPVSVYAPLTVWEETAPAPLPAQVSHVAPELPRLEISASAPTPATFPFWAVWLAGAAAVALWFLLVWRKSLRPLRNAVPVKAPLPAAWPPDSRRAVPVRQCEGISAPLACGLLRPAIFLPSEADKDLPALTCALDHEYAHIRRGDLWCKALITLALCLHWFNPLVWVMARYANRDLELACDEAAVRAASGDSRKTYALALLRWAEAENSAPVLCRFNQPLLQERITSIMKLKQRTLGGILAALLLIGGITAAFAATPAAPAEDTPSPAPASTSPEPIDTPAPLSVSWSWPMEGEHTVTCSFSSRVNPVTGEVVTHNGVDLSAPKGTPVLAVAEGTVTEAVFDAKLGNCVRLSHADGSVSLYAHLDTISVSAGDSVEQGGILGTLGQTGMVTGPCLHLEITDSAGVPANPLDILPN